MCSIARVRDPKELGHCKRQCQGSQERDKEQRLELRQTEPMPRKRVRHSREEAEASEAR